VLIHQPHGGAQGQQIDIEIQAREITFMRQRMEEVLAHHTGQPLERIHTDVDRDFIMSAHEAVEYGMVDAVLERSALVPIPSTQEAIK
jgi:ATP-dependent Clp protease protease subunit